MPADDPGHPPHLDADVALDLVLELLPDGSRELWLVHAAACPACESLLRRTAGDLERSRARALPALGLPAERAGSAPRGGPAWWWLAAAGVLVVAGGLWSLPRESELVLTAIPTPLPTAPGGPVTFAPQRDAGAADGPLRDALEAYRAGRLTEARDRLASLHALPPAHERLRRVYLADCELRLGDAGRSVAALEGVRMLSVPEPWQSQARWNQAVALAHLHRDSAARQALRELRQMGGPLSGRADSALHGSSERR